MAEATNAYRDYPPEQIAESMEKMIRYGSVCFMKWTCVGCGARITANTANTIYAKARHDECGAVTDIEEQGCNFLIVKALNRGSGASPHR